MKTLRKPDATTMFPGHGLPRRSRRYDLWLLSRGALWWWEREGLRP